MTGERSGDAGFFMGWAAMWGGIVGAAFVLIAASAGGSLGAVPFAITGAIAGAMFGIVGGASGIGLVTLVRALFPATRSTSPGFLFAFLGAALGLGLVVLAPLAAVVTRYEVPLGPPFWVWPTGAAGIAFALALGSISAGRAGFARVDPREPQR